MGWSRLPVEIWEKILDLVDTKGLQGAQDSCQSWKSIVLSYIMTGRLGKRALLFERLKYVGDGLYHRRNIRNTLAIQPECGPIMLTGFGIYGGTDEDLLDETFSITFDRSTTVIKIYERSTGELVTSQTAIWTTEQAKAYCRKGKPVPNTFPMFLKPPCRLEGGHIYDVEHNLKPTDVENHFSGWPVTILGAELWTCYGGGGTLEHAEFQFLESVLGGRSCLSEGQLPYFLWWPLTLES